MILQTKNKKKLGYLAYWKDSSKGEGFERPVIRTSRGMEEATIVLARAFFPDVDLTDKKIFFLDQDKHNLDPNNIAIVPSTIFNQLLNNHLITNDPKLNKLAIETLILKELTTNKDLDASYML